MSVAVIDLGYGDAGKGAVTDRLAASGRYCGVVRFNGGCQAAHNVVLDDGRRHTFAQFGSGTLRGLDTYLSRFMLVEPFSLAAEAAHLESLGVTSALSRVHIDFSALLTTPYHWQLNRYREDALGTSRHGSCGRGIGATVEYSLQDPQAPRAGDLLDLVVLDSKLRDLQRWCEKQSNHQMIPVDHERMMADYARLAPQLRIERDIFASVTGELIFEGAQGVLLDEDYGFHPHTTWSHTTARNARILAQELGLEMSILGLTRAYSSRHGAGPFVPEDNTLDLPEEHNRTEHYQGSWRVGHLDIMALRHAVKVSSPDVLYITHLDAIEREPRVQAATAYEIDGQVWSQIPLIDPEDFAARAEMTAQLDKGVAVLETLDPGGIHDLLGLRLAGQAWGPQAGEGDLPMLSVTDTGRMS